MTLDDKVTRNVIGDEMKKEIVFGPSVQGSLRMAQITGVGEFPKSMICTIKDDSGKVPDRIKRLNKENEEKWFDTLSLEKEISKEQIKHCSEKWKDLQKENLPLRMMVSGSIVSLHEEFLDSIIRDVIKNMSKTFKISRLVGEVMGKTELMLGDLIIFERVNSMIERGEILLAEEWQESAMRTLVKNNR